MRIEVGRSYKITTDTSAIHRTQAGCVDFMIEMAGRYVTVTHVRMREDGYAFFNIQEDGGRFNWCTDILVFEDKDRITKADDRAYTDFKVGDLVELRTLGDLISHYHYEKFTVKHMWSADTMKIVVNTYPCQAITEQGLSIEKDYSYYQGKQAVILFITDAGEVKLKFKDIKQPRIKFCTEMLKIVEEGFEKEEDMDLPKLEFEEDEIINEMISKVDKTKMKKILAGAIRMKATELKGIDKLLLQWAKAKKDLYVLLGKNLTITEKIDLEKQPEEMKYELLALRNQFPALSPLLAYMHTSCFTSNCINDFYYDEDDRDDPFYGSQIETYKKKRYEDN